MARKRYTREFKQQACRLVLGGTHSVADAAHELGLTDATMRSWLRRAGQKAPRRAMDLASDDPPVLKVQLRELQKKLEQAQMKRDILKKATAFFANLNP